jgi:hypothetical protein
MNRLSKKIVFLLVACLGLAACEPEPMVVRFATPEELAQAEISLTIAPDEALTKGSLLHDVESRGSGALVLVFRSSTGQLDSYRFFTEEEIQAQRSVPLKLRVPLTTCDFYILGNLNAVNKSDGRVTHLMEALGSAFPADETSLEALVYRLDGGDLNATWRRERFAEVAACGLPYVHISKDVDTGTQISQGQGIPGSDACRRLFSKVTLHIDHGAFDGEGAHPDFFVNSSLHLRQANARLQPFSPAPQHAAQAEDVLSESDYDPDMTASNASVTTFSFYVPENMQGTLLPGNTDSRRKTRDELLRQGLSAVESFLTYVEFVGCLDPAAGGYGADVTYRFYLGADNCSNFDLARNREYEIALSFRVGSLFEPDWKVEPSDWQDGRLFCLTADAAFTDRLPEGRNVAVRKGRDGAFYVYMNPAGQLGRENALAGKNALGGGSFTPSSLADCAWRADFLQSGTQDYQWLSDRGIRASWDAALARLKFSVIDPARFNAHLGDARLLKLSLLPGGGDLNFSLRLYEDISVTVADGKSLTRDFYLGQKRHLSVSGFAGSTLCYAADQDPCGRSASGTAHTANRQWKTSSSESASFPTARLDGSGAVLLDPAAYPEQRLTDGGLDVYAFYPNRFQASHGGWTSRDGRILVFSEDRLNDSVEIPIRISEPRLVSESRDIFLPIDGGEVTTPLGYWNFDGTARIGADAFEASLYTSLLGLELRSAYNTHTSWMSCLSLDPATGEMSVRATTSGGLRMEELSYSTVNGAYSTSLGYVLLRPEKLTDLFSGGGNFPLRVSHLNINSLMSGLNTIFESTPTNPTSVMFSNYFNTGTQSQLGEDVSFGVRADFSFFHGDLSRIEWERSGDATSYTCRKAPYETLQPVIDFVVEEADEGSGGTFSWVYNEAHQHQFSSGGEPVPGGLIIPFGQQLMTGTITNKWDGRQFKVRSGFYLTYPRINNDLLIVARSGQAKASVYLMPLKISKYLKRLGQQVDADSRHWMMQLFGSSDWMSRVTLSDCYMKRSGTNDYYAPGNRTGTPLADYDVKYAWYYLNGNENATVWTQDILDRVASSIPSRSIARIIQLDPANYHSDYFDGLDGFSIPEGKTCIFWTGPGAF